MPSDPARVRGRRLVNALHAARGDFSTDAQRAKADALRTLTRARVESANAAARLHDELLFLAAFPDNPQVASLANEILDGFARRVERLPARARSHLNDSGIAGSTSAHTFMYGAVRWLVEHGERASPAWKRGHTAEDLGPFVRASLLQAELDAFESGAFTTRQWIEQAASHTPGGPLHWLVGGEGHDPILRDLYDHAEVPVEWMIGDSPRSVTRNRGPSGEQVFRHVFRRPPADPVAWIARPLAGVRRARGNEARAWIDASIAAIVARCREVSPTIYANPEEIYVADLGAGAQLCVLGAHPADRLALEANYGYVMFSNGVPIGYGGVTPLADQANTGANLFEAFRRSEAHFLFGQSLRAFRALFGISRFIVNPFQFGADNDEALQSGAFWFYHRLGFRPVDAELRALADRERARLAARPGTRSPLAILRRLTRADLVLELDPRSPVPLFDEVNLQTIGRLVAREFAATPHAGRSTHMRQLVREHARLLGQGNRRLNVAERHGAHLLSPVITLIGDVVKDWTPEQRGALWELVRAKGAQQERNFARLAKGHAPFWRALARRAGSDVPS